MIFEELDPDYPSKGYYRFNASLEPKAGSIVAWAIFTFSTQTVRIPLGVSFTGRLHEIVRCPKLAHTVRLEVYINGQLASNIDWSCQRLNTLKTQLTLLRRFFHYRKVLLGNFAQRAQLSYSKLLLSPFRVYRLLGYLRYHFPAPTLRFWLDRFWAFSPNEKKRAVHFVHRNRELLRQCRIVIDARRDSVTLSARLKHSLSSLKAAVGYKYLSVTVLNDKNSALLDNSEYRWVLWMESGCQLQPYALAWFLYQIAQYPSAKWIYSDHTVDTNQAPSQSYFKPDWSPIFQMASGYIGHVFCIRGDIYRSIVNLGVPPNAFQFSLSIMKRVQANEASHIRAPLWCCDASLMSQPSNDELEAHLHQGEKVVSDRNGFPRIKYPLPTTLPKVSIIIPTRDRLELIQPCLESVLRKSTYANYEILIVDNQTTCPKTLAFFRQVQEQYSCVNVITYDAPFNYSAINNFAVEQASGELLCLLNNDTEVITTDWLEEMASRLLQPNVGVVGARLYYSDGSIQHAGDVVGPGGCANHLHNRLAADDLGYMARAHLPQELSAVTAACLLTHKKLFEQVGGLNEKQLPVAFNDVDYCLKIRELGYWVQYTPYAELYHHESVSRKADVTTAQKARSRKEVKYMRTRWAKVIECDPFYNPNLNFAKPDFTLARVPKETWPW